MNYNKLTKRITIAILGMICLGIGVNLLLGTKLGVPPLDTLNQQISEIFSISFGNATFLFDFFFFLILLIFTAKIFDSIKIDLIELLISLGSIFLLTRFINFFEFLQFNNLNYIFTILVGFLLYSLGFKLMYDSNLIIAPADKFIVVISNLFQIKEGTGKLVFDIVLIIISIILFLIATTSTRITILSIILAVLTGPMINLYGKILKI